MKVLLDTSVLAAAMVKAHPAHVAAAARLQRIRRRQDAGIDSTRYCRNLRNCAINDDGNALILAATGWRR